ncbi:MAG: hypothetical protein QMD16_16700, partial [Desulfitobacteriaceae bacterium]|nr:hypothetical protein [Desulfitobacteriaceae bacterium]
KYEVPLPLVEVGVSRLDQPEKVRDELRTFVGEMPTFRILNDYLPLFNQPYSLHRLFNLKEYKAGKYVVASQKQFQLDRDLLAKGEKPSVYLDFPVDVADYELIDLFNWQDEVKDMISQLEFVRMVDVQTETIERYIREGKIAPDLEVPLGDKRSNHLIE